MGGRDVFVWFFALSMQFLVKLGFFQKSKINVLDGAAKNCKKPFSKANNKARKS